MDVGYLNPHAEGGQTDLNLMTMMMQSSEKLTEFLQPQSSMDFLVPQHTNYFNNTQTAIGLQSPPAAFVYLPTSASFPTTETSDPVVNPNGSTFELSIGSGEDASAGQGTGRRASVEAMREMIFRMAAMQPVHIDPEAVKPPKRRNVRISKDPQSVAARHRRERISERIRILQRLVPGGTKMDTASMLDEAIHYVKFLKNQLQSLERASRNVPIGFPAATAAVGFSGGNYSCVGRIYELPDQGFMANSTTQMLS